MDVFTSANQRAIIYSNLIVDPIQTVITSHFANMKTKLNYNVRM